MKNLKIIAALLSISFLQFSCKKELEPQKTSSGTFASPFAPASSTSSVVTNPPAATNPGQNNIPVQQQQLQQQQQVQTQKTAAGMNPPHGQSGHRCDIAVGAPLNSAKAAVANVVSAPVVNTPQSTPSTAIPATLTVPNAPAVSTPEVVTAPGMNPPHGKEGHRCDTAVGAPLPKS